MRLGAFVVVASVWLWAVGCSSPIAAVSDAASAPDAATATDGDTTTFKLTSTAFQDQGTLPVIYTCDGAGHSPPLAWTGTPKGTVEFALLMTTLALDGLKWNWVLYRIPGNVGSLAESTMGVGAAGLTSDGPALAYSPPCSQGPGAKTYTFTVYALSASPALPMPANQVTGRVLTDAVAAITLAKSALDVSYTR